MPDSPGDFDVAILGGGLAALTLGLQLKAARPQTSIAILEKRVGPAPEAAFKVGESTVEVSTNYFADVVGMRDHLDAEQLPKCGLRFFFPAGNNEDIALRVEYGSPAIPPSTPTRSTAGASRTSWRPATRRPATRSSRARGCRRSS